MSQTQQYQPVSAAATTGMSQPPQQPMGGARPDRPRFPGQLTGQSQDMMLAQVLAQSQSRQTQGQDGSQVSREPREKLPSVYVGNLPKDYYQLDLYKLVKQMGYAVFQAVINIDKTTKRQNRYGFLQFHNIAEAKRAAEGLNNTLINGSYIRTALQEDNFIDQKANVFVKNLDPTTTQQDLYDSFEKFGKVRSCKLELYDDNKSRGFGYVQFEEPDSADKAIAASGDFEIKGKKIEILPHQRRDQRKGTETKCLNIYVQGLPTGCDEKQLKELFSKFGEIASVHVQRGDSEDCLKNRGFVSFKEGDSADAAIKEYNKKQMDDGSYLLVTQHISQKESQVTTSGNTVQNSIRKTFESNLFVRNIPAELSEDDVVQQFSQCGPIISIKMKKGKNFNPNSAYRNYFILFKDVEDAKKAIQKYDHSTPFGARALDVQHWMPSTELHQERENRSFQQVQQYFFKNFYPPHMSGYGGMGGEGRPMHDRRQGQDQGGAQGGAQGGMRQNYRRDGDQQNNYRRDNDQNRQGGNRNYQNKGQYQNNRGNNQYHQRNNMGQDNRNRNPRMGDGQNSQPFNAAPMGGQNPMMMQQQQQQMTPDQHQAFLAMQQQQPVQQPAAGNAAGLNADPAIRRQQIGDAIYQTILQNYGDHASKITGMLLDNDKIVDPVRLVQDVAYLEEKALEAYTLLSQASQQPAEMGQTQTQDQ